MNSVRLVLAASLLLITQDLVQARDNPWFPTIERFKLHLAKGGGGTIEVASVWDASLYASLKDDADPNAQYGFADYGVKNCETISSKTDGKVVRVVQRGDVADIFQFVSIVHSGRPFQLGPYVSIDLAWNGKSLRLRMENLHPDKTTTPDSWGYVIEITTEGRFSENSIGEVSADRSTITIKHGKVFFIEVEDLGAKR